MADPWRDGAPPLTRSPAMSPPRRATAASFGMWVLIVILLDRGSRRLPKPCCPVKPSTRTISGNYGPARRRFGRVRSLPRRSSLGQIYGVAEEGLVLLPGVHVAG